MWQNSIELLDYALRELQVAVKENKPKVKIVLKDKFSGGLNEIREFSDKFELKTITEILREEFSDYEIKSIVGTNGELQAILSLRDMPCSLYYSLIWELTLRKK